MPACNKRFGAPTALVVEFDADGHVVSHALLEAGTGAYGAEIAPRVYHCIIALEPGSVVYEVKNGPYSPLDDKNFATWAPKEGEEGCRAYLEQLIVTYDKSKFITSHC